MRAGKLRHRLTFEHYTTTKNSFGEDVKTWSRYVTVWGALIPISGREYILAEAEKNVVNYKAVIRYRAGLTITPDMRMKKGDRYFQIISNPVTNESNREIIIRCNEMV